MAQDPHKGHKALRRGRAWLPGQIYNATATTLRRQRFFLDFRAACAASASFSSGSLGGAHLLCWALMPDHAHWLLQLGERDSLDTVVGRLKANSARAANIALQRTGTLWSRAYHNHALRNDEDHGGTANPGRVGG